MAGFLCDFLNEVVILADGRVTTCCLDPLAMNVYGNIYRDSFLDVNKRYYNVVTSITNDVLSMPRCQICYKKIKDACFPNTGTYKVNFTPEEKETFLNEKSKIRQLVIEPTCLCNLKCNGCMQSRFDISGSRQAQQLDLPYVESWISRHLNEIKAIRLYNYGETFLNSGAIPFVKSIKNANKHISIDIATNGLKLDTPQKRADLILSGVDILYFSIHGGREASIQKYMTDKFSLSKVLSIIEDLSRFKQLYNLDAPKLIWKYLLFSWNDSPEEIEEAMARAQIVGIDKMIFVVPGYPSPSHYYRDNKHLVQALNKQYQRVLP